MRSCTSIRIAKVSYISISALYCVLGIVLIACPRITAAVIGYMIGASMIAFGLIKLLGYFSKDLYRLAFQHDLAFGTLMLALGILILARPELLLKSLCVICGIAALSDGLLKIQTAIDAKRFGIHVWYVLMASAVAACVLGILLILRPAESTLAFATVMGVAVLAEGVLNLLTAVFTVKVGSEPRHIVTQFSDDTDN